MARKPTYEELEQKVDELEEEVRDQMRLDERLREGEERYRKLFESCFEHISSGVAIYEAKDNGNDFILKDFNRAGERIENIKKEDLIGKSVLEVFPGIKEFGLFDVFKSVWESGKPEDHPVSLYKDERIMGWRENYVYKLPSGEIVAVYDDITERKLAEEKLKRSEEKFAKAFRYGPTLMTISSIEDGKYIEVNENFVRITGYGREESIGTTSVDLGFISKEDRNKLKQGIIENGRAEGMELTLRKKDGDTLYCLYFGEIITIDGEQRLLSIASDITDRKHSEERIEHINLVLSAIRNVNQLITREKDRGKLLQGVCNNLVETRGYYNAWVVLLDESGKVLKTAEAGLGDDFLPMSELLKRGELTDCGRTALSQSDIVITEDPSSTCADCPLAEKYMGKWAMTIRLEHEGKVYGLLSVSIAGDLIAYKEEQGLFREVTEDIAYALYNMEQEDERKRIEMALRESEGKYRSLVETITDLVFIIGTNGRLTFLNPEFEKLTGYPAQDFIGHPFTEVLVPEYIESTVDRFKRGLSGETIPVYEVELKHKDGKKVPVELKVTSLLDSDGNTIGRIGVARDLSERKRTEEELQQSEKRLNTILDSIQAGIVIIDEETHEIIDANPAAIKMIGAPKEEIIGRACNKYICSAEEGACPITDLGQKMDNLECILLKANGEEVPILKTVAPILLDGKNCLLETFIDITEKIKLQAQLQQAQKMEAIGTLAGGIAHDFNNIMQIISGYAQILLLDKEEDNPDFDKLQGIEKSVERGVNLIQGLLVF
ncbi:MAG: PAS domain S-box protein, partial [Deltaproteobacteria bacterium]|nr:PAS domain S-box protein [Deltaproteobacteria bacterium]